MSLTVNSYLNGSFRTWTANEEKQKQNDTAEAGKTQQNGASASLDQINMGEDGAAVNQVSRLQGTELSGGQQQSAAPHTDVVEISEAGKAACSRVQDQQTDADEVEEYTSETEDLSEYTDAELKQMYYRGEITRQEYEEETGESLDE